MCTLSLLPYKDTLYAGMNRDEVKTRPLSKKVISVKGGALECIYPQDSLSQGTWIGCTNSGHLFALLNYYPPGVQHSNSVASRGKIIVELIKQKDPAPSQIKEILLSTFRNYNPFRLIHASVKDRSMTEFISDTHKLQSSSYAWKAQIFSSSSYLETIAQQSRKALFQKFLNKEKISLKALRSFHTLQEDLLNPHKNIFIERKDVHTESIFLAALSKKTLEFQYLQKHEIS